MLNARFLVISLCALAGAARAQAPPASAATTQAAQRPPDLRTLANASVHAIRARQEADGSYGGSVKTTGLAIFGLARCVRQYREADGAFITKAVEYLFKARNADGGFYLQNDTDPAGASLAAALALEALDAKKYAEVTKAAASFAAAKAGKAFVPGHGAIEHLAGATAPELAPRVPADSDAANAQLAAAADLTKMDAAQLAPRLVYINKLQTLSPPPMPQELPPVALPRYDPRSNVNIDDAARRGLAFLIKRQAPDGSFGSPMMRDQWVGVTSLVAQALWSCPPPGPPEILAAAERATAFVAAAARPDGSIHGGGLENYSTSAAVGALAASKNPKYREIVDRAREYISQLQADEGEGYSSEHWAYGGFGYGNEERPDMSNTNFALDALKAAGAGSGDPAIRKALAFLERCQNRSESNTTEIVREGVVAVAGNDGGGVYHPGKSQAGSNKTADGKKEIPRSYGSMSYALLKGFIFAGLRKDDPRLKAVYDWCRNHYTLERVPGYEEIAAASPRAAFQGLFYYYLTMAAALAAYGEDAIETPDGKKHAWRVEMSSRVVSLQKPDGAWINENSPRWWEGDEIIATAYAALTLGHLRK